MSLTVVENQEQSQKIEAGSFNSGVIHKSECFDLFISYKRDNGGDHGQVLAEELYRKLKADGFKVWLDNEEIGFSNDYEVRLEQALLHSKKVACVIGPGWVNSPNCQFELKKAVEFEKSIIPIHYQGFRSLLLEKKETGVLTSHEWRRVDRPQELDFSIQSKHKKSYSDLKALCRLNDKYYLNHTRVLCEAYYWLSHNRPKSMLRTGTNLSKAKLLKRKCDSDDNYPTFSQIQNEFMEASEKYVSREVSNKRKVYITCSPEKYEYASELNFELKLHNISTWFDEAQNQQPDDEKAFVESIINSENVLDIAVDGTANNNVKVAFARSNNKRVLRITDSEGVLDQLREQGEKNIYLWNDQVNIDQLITTINGDKAYNQAHAKLLEETFRWEKSEKKDSKLLSYSEAVSKQQWYKEAEKSGAEPQPNLDMINFVERSLARAQAIRKRKQMMRVTLGIGIIVLLIFGYLSIRLQGDLKAQNKVLDEAKNNTEKAEKQAEYVKDVADSVSREAQIAQEQARKDVEAAEEEIRNAEAKRILAESQADEAREERKAALDSASKALIQADTAQRRALASLAKAAEADKNLFAALDRLAKAKKESDSISFITRGKVAANSALEYVQLRQYKSAADSADRAVVLLTDSVAGSASIQSLYTVYNQLLPDESPLGLGFKEEERVWNELKEVLVSRPDLRENQYPLQSMSLLSEEVTLGWNNSSADTTQLLKMLRQAEVEMEKISTLCLHPEAKWLAVGYKAGDVEIWDMETKEVIERIVNHAYRITSVAFNPSGNQLAISSIDKTFSLVALNKQGARDGKSEIIKQRNGVRAKAIFYWNDAILVTRSWKDISKAWGTDVLELRRELEKNQVPKSNSQ